MLAYACDFAFGRRPAAAPARARVPELVGAASVPGPAAGRGVIGPDTGQARGPAAGTARGPAGFWMRLAFTLTCGGLVAHVVGVAARGLSEHRVPWGNMYEF